MNKKFLIAATILVLAFIFFQFVIIYPLPESNCVKYFFVRFSEIINIVVLGFVAYCFVEYKNDSRAQKLLILQMIQRAIERCSDERMWNIRDEDSLIYLRANQRSLNNEISLLSKTAEKYDYVNESNYCLKKHKEYWDKVSENITDFEKLASLKNSLTNDLQLLTNKLEEISFKLYEN